MRSMPCLRPLCPFNYARLYITHYTAVGSTTPALAEHLAYDYNVGKATQYTDVNGNPTSYIYSDTLDRLTNVNRPDRGSTSIAYVDTPGSVSASISVAQSSGTPIVTQVQYDGLGRKVAGALSETGNIASGSSIVTTYGYDGRGRQDCVSLPYRGSTSSGCSVVNGQIQNGVLGTMTQYDGMNRTTAIIEEDGSTTRTGYLNNETAVQDPAGFLRLSVVDGAGRMTSVQENPTSGLPPGITPSASLSGLPTFTTTYGYDALDDLTSVTQTDPGNNGYTLSRSFTYDSFKRLVQAFNPESGTIKYQYDASGNLSARIDSVVTGTPRTVNFPAYDGLNRATIKSYSDGTPQVNYSYGDGLARISHRTMAKSRFSWHN